MMHRRMIKPVTLIIFIVLMILLLAGCGVRNSLVKTWVADDGETIEFFKDGTVLIEDSFFSASGKYSIVDKNRVRVEMDGFWGIAGAQVLQYSVSGNRLTLEGTHYTKAR